MAAALPGFMSASDLGPSPSENEQLRELCREQAEQIERLQDGIESRPELKCPPAKAQASLRPDEKQQLLQVISNLGHRVEDLERLAARQARETEELRKKNKDLDKELYEVRQMARTIIQDACKRITAIEDKNKPQKTDVTLGHINALASELLIRAKAGQRGVTYAEAAKILRLDKSRVCQLRGLIASDSRFNVDWHPNRKNTKVICLKNYKTKEIV